MTDQGPKFARLLRQTGERTANWKKAAAASMTITAAGSFFACTFIGSDRHPGPISGGQVLIFFLLGMAITCFIARRWRRYDAQLVRLDRGRCPICDYDCAGLQSDKCPECGQTLA